MGGGVSVVYDKSIFVGYLMPNRFYTYRIYMIYKYTLLKAFLNDPEPTFNHIVKWFQVLLYNSHNLTSVICLYVFK